MCNPSLLRAAFIPAVFLLSFALSLAAQAHPQTLDEDKFDINMLELGKTDWHGIYIGDKKSGYMRSSFENRGPAGKEVIASVTKTEMKLLVQGRVTRITTLEVLEFSPEAPYEMVTGYFSVENNLGRRTIKASVQNGTLTADIEEASGRRTQVLNDFKYRLPQVAIYSLVDFNTLKVEETFEFNQLNLSELRFDPQSVKYLGAKESTIDGIKVKYHQADVTSQAHDSTGRFRFGPENDLLSAVIGGAFEVRKESETDAKNFGFSADLAVLGVIRVNQPIGNPTAVSALELKVSPAFAKAIRSGPSQKIETVNGNYVLKLGRKHGVNEPSTQQEYTEHLKETVAHPINDTAVKRLAAEAVGNEENTLAKVQKIVTFVSTYLDDSLNDNSTSVLDIIKRRSGDCTEHAKLFATLAKASGIPAREVGGFIYIGDGPRAFGQHVWNEVIVDGYWRAVDPMWNETNINATHIQIQERSQLYSLGSTLELINVERN